METPLQKIKDFCQDQENEFSVLGYDASKYELGYISAIREIQEICEEIPDQTAQLQSDKEELAEALEEIFANEEMEGRLRVCGYYEKLQSLIQKMKQ